MPTIGIVTVSDRASRGEYQDRSGPAIESWLSTRLIGDWAPERRLVPDERPEIEATLRELVGLGCSLIVATGGTGPSPRDVTPDAVEAVCTRFFPGFGERMRATAWDRIPTAILSRQIAGSLESSLILALPGSPKAIAECLEAVFPAIPHCVELLGGAPLSTADGSNPEH